MADVFESLVLFINMRAGALPHGHGSRHEHNGDDDRREAGHANDSDDDYQGGAY